MELLGKHFGNTRHTAESLCDSIINRSRLSFCCAFCFALHQHNANINSTCATTSLAITCAITIRLPSLPPSTHRCARTTLPTTPPLTYEYPIPFCNKQHLFQPLLLVLNALVSLGLPLSFPLLSYSFIPTFASF